MNNSAAKLASCRHESANDAKDERFRSNIWMFRRAFSVAILILMFAVAADAAPLYSDFFTAANPQHFSLTMFAAGMGAESKYVATHEGFELEQTLTPYVSAVGRVAGYQGYQGDG